MKMYVLGVKRVYGTKKEGGDTFDMGRLFAGAPVEQVTKPNVKINGYGLDVGEMDLAPEAVEAFAKVQLPAELELTTEPRLWQGEFKTFVTGIAAAAATSLRKAG